MKLLKKIAIAFSLLLVAFAHLSAQPELQKLPIDSKVRYGKLDNGLTYYIRHNELPKERASFYIAQRVGSILEEDNQAGLAHFLEHMAFNGTKSYPENKLTDYLETVGVKFGVNLNAYTSFEKTVYNISNVPTTREGITDSCLLVLHDWSSFISLDPKEIDKERGVIREEMRSYAEAYMRMIEKLLPQIMPGSQYAKRMPIGTEEVVMNFKYDELKEYYKKWYRPDLQGIVIIGDFDVDAMENKIKTLFADIPKPVNPAQRTEYFVEDNKAPLVGIATDKEATSTEISIYYKNDPLPENMKGTIAHLAVNYFNEIVANMLNERFREITNKANPPFVYAGGGYGNFFVVATKDAWSTFAVCKEKGDETALKAIVRETERAKRFGFTASEYERAKINIVKRYENSFNEKDKVQNDIYAREYAQHFTERDYIPGIEAEYNMIQSIVPTIPLEKINQYFAQLIKEENIVISLSAPEKEGIKTPDKEQLVAWFNEAKAEDIQAYEEKIITEPLLATLPTGGKIVSETKDNVLGTTNITLSNGVKVVIRPTTFKDDEILMRATSPGGSSHFPEKEIVNLKMYGPICNLGGLGSFSATDLPKVLAGKKVSVQPSINLTTEGFNGSSSPKDFETMLQLIYLHFTAPRMDQEAFQSLIGRQKSMLESQEASPMTAFSDTINTFSVNKERSNRLRAADMEKVNYQTIIDWRKDRYKDASDFTFVFVGNINADSTKNKLTQYLGSLPSTNRKESFAPVKMGYKNGALKNHFEKQVENPKATVLDIYSGTIEPTLSNRIKFDALTQILNIVYVEKVREKEGGTYGVHVYSDISFYPKGQAMMQMYFETEPEKKDFLNGIIHTELNSIVKQGPRIEDLNKVKEFMLKKQKENEQENSYWAGTITGFYENKQDSYTNYSSIVESLTIKDIQNIANSFVSQGNTIEVVMSGVKIQ